MKFYQKAVITNPTENKGEDLIHVKMSTLIGVLTDIKDKYLAEQVLQALGINYDSGE